MKILFSISISLIVVTLILVVVKTLRKNGKSPTSTDEGLWDKKLKQVMGVIKNSMTILLIIVAIVLFYFGIYKPSWDNPSLSETVNRMRSNWLVVLILAGVLYFLIQRITDAATKKTFSGALVLALIAVFIALPAWFWLMAPSTSGSSKAQPSIPLASEPVAKWKQIQLPPKGTSEHFPIPPGMRAMVNGNRLSVHTLYADGNECTRASEGSGSDTICPNGPVTGVYVTNVANEANIVSYAFEPL